MFLNYILGELFLEGGGALLIPLWLNSLVIGRLVLWPIRRTVCQASIQPAASVASNANPARVSSHHVETHRRSAPPAWTVSKNSMIVVIKAIYNAHIYGHNHTSANIPTSKHFQIYRMNSYWTLWLWKILNIISFIIIKHILNNGPGCISKDLQGLTRVGYSVLKTLG